jgi:2-iminobutanoate/2-iminopropanoate deaminase
MSKMNYTRTNTAPPPGGAYTQAVAVSDLIATAGQVGKDPESGEIPPGIEAQIRLAVRNLRAVLEASGSSLDRVIKTTCFLSDIALFPQFDLVYGELFPEPRPARSTVGVALAGDLLFEIEALAVKNSGD